MKIIIISCVISLLLIVGLWIWRKLSDLRLEAEIDRIKIPDDTFDEPENQRKVT